MKICPTCDKKFDDEVLRFCTKDGTPLIEEGAPNFVAMPSESLEEPEDDIGEITIIRKKEVPPVPPSIDEANSSVPSTPAERFVIPTSSPVEQAVRARTVPAYYPPLEKPNTVKVVVLTIIGTIALLGLGAGMFWFLQRDKPANTNRNLNTNLGSFNGNLGSNINIDNNFNFSTNPNFNTAYNSNLNLNANLKSPSPTPKPSPSVTPSPSPTPDNSPTPLPTPRFTNVRPPANTRPTPAPTPRTGPRPTPANTN